MTTSASESVDVTVPPAPASTAITSVTWGVRTWTRPSDLRRQKLAHARLRDQAAASDDDERRPQCPRARSSGGSTRTRSRPSSASDRRKARIQRIPSGSSPLTGSSNTSTGGSPSIAAAIPRRCAIPSEKPPVRLRAASARPTSSSTSSTRRAGRRLLRASHSRWLRARRPGCVASASSSAPTSRSGGGQIAVPSPADA